jgi:hypothetical protein
VSPVFSDRQRSDPRPSSGEPLYTFLDRVAGPFWDRIRQLIEDWANDYSPGERADVVGRLQNRRDIDFTGAYWELFLHQGLKALGFEVTCHPEVAGTRKRPDFLAEGDRCSFYIEAKVLGDDLADLRRDKNRSAIDHELNARVHSDGFVVQLQFAKDGARPIPIKKLADLVDATQAWLDGLNIRGQTGVPRPLAVTRHVWDDERSGWSVALTAMPRSSGRGGGRIVGVTGPHVGWADDLTPIRKALYKKAHKYGDDLGKPLVVALGLQRPFADDTDLLDALFGDDIYQFDPSTGDGNSARKSNGLVTGPMGPRSRRLSAVLVSNNVAPWSAAKTSLTLWKNPWATFPLRCDAGGVVTIIDAQDDGSLATTAASVSTGELLGLPQDWPGPSRRSPGTERGPPEVGRRAELSRAGRADRRAGGVTGLLVGRQVGS